MPPLCHAALLGMGWFRKLGEWRAERHAYRVGRQVVTQTLMEQQAMSARMGTKLHGDYMALRNALADGTYAPNHDDPTADLLQMFRAGLRIVFNTEDELAAFDVFARDYTSTARSLRHGPDVMARHESELQMVRDSLVEHRVR